MLVTIFGYWCRYFVIDDIFWMLVPAAYIKREDVDDENGQKRHQHLKIVTNAFGLQHPSPTLM